MPEGSRPGVSPWIILGCCFFTQFFGGSLLSASGVLHVSLLQRYGKGITETAWQGGLFASLFSLAGPLAGVIINRFTCRVGIVVGGVSCLIAFTVSSFCDNFYLLFFTYGILGGTGQCLCYTSAVIAVGLNFDRNRNLATGVVVSGFATGQIVFPTFVQILLDNYGLQGTFLILGAVCFQVCVFGGLIRPQTSEIRRSHKGSIQCTSICQNLLDYMNLFLYPPMLFFCLSVFCWSTSLTIVTVHTTNYYRIAGSSTQEASYLTSVIGIGSLSARILVGIAANEGGLDGPLLYFGSYLILGTFTCCVTLYGHTLAGRVINSLVQGLYQGGTWCLLSPITVKVVGIEKLATAFGMELLFIGIGALVGPVLSGLILERSGSYLFLFIFTGLMDIIQLLTSIEVYIDSGRRQRSILFTTGLMDILAAVFGILMMMFKGKTVEQDHDGHTEKSQENFDNVPLESSKLIPDEVSQKSAKSIPIDDNILESRNDNSTLLSEYPDKHLQESESLM